MALAQSVPAGAATLFETTQSYLSSQDYMLLRINNERAKAGVGPVRLDLAACEAALRHAQDMRARRYFSHWNPDGLKPTRRWNLIGAYDNLSENIYYRQYELGDERKVVDDAMSTLLDSPGHRKTILYADFTSVGIAFEHAPGSEEVWVVQEFCARLGGEYRCPLAAKLGEAITFQGRVDPGRYSLAGITVGWDELPKPRNGSWLAKTGEYKDAEKMIAAYSPNPNLTFDGLDTHHDVRWDPKSGAFEASIKLDYKHKEGTYCLFVWLDDRQAGKQVLAAIATVEARLR